MSTPISTTRLAWETESQYQYRLTASKLAFSIAKVLTALEGILISGGSDTSKLRADLNRARKRLGGVVPPSMYEESHGFLVQCVGSYIAATDELKAAIPVQDGKGLLRAARLVTEGNSFLNISKSRLWQAIEKKTAEG